MSGGRPMPVLAALVGGLVLALLVGMLLVRGMREVAPTPEEADPDPGTAPAAVPLRPAAAPSPHPVPHPPAPALPAVPSPEPLPIVLAVEAALEDGTPLPGVSFLGMIRDEAGEPDVSLEPDALFPEATDAEGKCSLRWKVAPAEVLVLVLSRSAEVVGVGGGTLVRPDPDVSGEVVVAPPAPGPLRLTMRTRPGVGGVRPVDSATGKVLFAAASLPSTMCRLIVRNPDGTEVPALQGSPFPDEEGVFRLACPRLPRTDPRAPDERILEVHFTGYETGRLPLATLRGVVDISMDPKVPSVVGEIHVPDIEPGTVFAVSLASRDGKPPRGVAETGSAWRAEILPAAAGPFALFDLPDGGWVLRFMARSKEGIRWARRSFEKSGATVDLGRIEASIGVGLRVRFLDEEGTPATGPRIEVASMDAPFLWTKNFVVYRRDGETNPLLNDRMDIPSGAGNPDAEGWFEFQDLAPGTRHRVALPERPYAATEVTTSTDPGTVTRVELRAPPDSTRCDLRLTLRGRTPANWAFATEGPVALPLSREGVLRCWIPPGSHRLDIGVMVTTREGSILEVHRATVEIPEREAYEAEVEVE